MAILEVRNLSRHFGGLVAVSGLSFSVGEGEIRGLIGPNGAGKTTTFNVISGFIRRAPEACCSEARTSPACAPAPSRPVAW